MLKNVKVLFKYFLINGLIFSIMNALLDYFGGDPFSIEKFIFHFVVFGFSMGLLWFAMDKGRDHFISKHKNKTDDI